MRLNDIGKGKETNMFVEKFNSVEEIKECAKYYISLLGLQDWMIKFELTDDLSDEDNAGENEYCFILKESIIKIRRSHPDNPIFKYPQEQTLIHELLHCKFGGIEQEEYQYEHQLLQDIARAIFNVRYNLTNDYYIIDNK